MLKLKQNVSLSFDLTSAATLDIKAYSIKLFTLVIITTCVK
jgi:hypothetical protein